MTDAIEKPIQRAEKPPITANKIPESRVSVDEKAVPAFISRLMNRKKKD